MVRLCHTDSMTPWRWLGNPSSVCTDWPSEALRLEQVLTLPQTLARKLQTEISQLTGHPFITAPNKFAAQGSLDAMAVASAALRALAVALMKIANDLRWLGSGPRAGLPNSSYQVTNRVAQSCQGKSIQHKRKLW